MEKLVSYDDVILTILKLTREENEKNAKFYKDNPYSDNERKHANIIITAAYHQVAHAISKLNGRNI